MFEKISKSTARKLYEQKEPFVMCASKLRPGLFGVEIGRYSFEHLIDETFEIAVNSFSYYHCNKDSGKRVAFYRYHED